jgi:predicted nucleic acid-binding protein
MKRVALDTGPLVALINRRDRHHDWAVQCFDEFDAPTETCDAVLSEACFLLRDLHDGPQAVLDLVERGVVVPTFHVEGETLSLLKLMNRYAKVPMSLADACLVRMTEVVPATRILTIDRDFLIYRRHGRQSVPVLMPT